MAFHIGQRLRFDGQLCTVRYLGTLSSTKGEWVGVEWDDSSRGKHAGRHHGQQIFQCLSTSHTAASFIRPTRRPDPTRSVLEAIRHKYGSSQPANGHFHHPSRDTIEISGKTVVEVGFEKIEQQMARFAELKVVLLDELQITSVAKPGSDVQPAQDELGSVCPNIAELDLGWNPVESWQDIADVCRPLKKLRVLKASGLRFRNFDAKLLFDGRSPFEKITELQLNECLLRPNQIIQLLACNARPLFPNLHILWISQNDLSTFDIPDNTIRFPTVITLILENNKFVSLCQISSLTTMFPNLTTLSLEGNAISTIDTTAISTKITSLNLADNLIESFNFVEGLPALFPNLTSLRISKNPLYEQPSASSQPQPNPLLNATPTSQPPPPTTFASSTSPSYYLMLARIPSLLTLNHSPITPLDRQEGEIYYLSITEKEIHSLLPTSSITKRSELSDKFALYTRLCEKYDRPNILFDDSSSTSTTAGTGGRGISSGADGKSYPPGSLGSRLVHASFYIADSNPRSATTPTPTELQRALPNTLGVYTVKAQLARYFRLPHLSFRLVYESPELDPVEPVEATTRKSAMQGMGQREEWPDWGDWDCDVPPPSPARPAYADGADVAVDGEDNGDAEPAQEGDHEGRWEGGILVKNGVRWKRREVEILDGMRGWGDYLDRERDVRIRVESYGR